MAAALSVLVGQLDTKYHAEEPFEKEGARIKAKSRSSGGEYYIWLARWPDAGGRNRSSSGGGVCSLGFIVLNI